MLNAKSLRISAKLPLIIVSAALMLAVGIGTAGYWTASKSKVEGVKDKFSAVLEDRKHALSIYLGSIEQDLRSVARQSIHARRAERVQSRMGPAGR